VAIRRDAHAADAQRRDAGRDADDERSPALNTAAMTRLVLVAVAFACLAAPAAHASDPTNEPPDRGGFTRAMGMPLRVRQTAGVEYLVYRPIDGSQNGGLVNIGASRMIGNPVIGAAALGLEFYAGGHAGTFDGGGRAYFSIPALLLGLGVDQSVKDTDFILKLDLPMRRGGIVGAGSAMTLRWLPGRGQTFTAGVTFPFGDRDIGHTRARQDHVQMDDREPERRGTVDIRGKDRDLCVILDSLRVRARWVARMTQPFAEHDGGDAREAMAPHIASLRAHMAEVDAAFPHGHTANEEIRVYHETLDRAFSIAESGTNLGAGESTELGRRISANARRILLDDILFPYDALLGQLKKPDTVSGLVAVAQTDFARWLALSQGVDLARGQQVLFVFQTLCDQMEQNREELRERWGDARYVWIPLQYGLTPGECDTQGELDGIIERATQQQFTAGNRIEYVINEEFQYEVAHAVRAAEDYLVVWIHDVSGVNHHGKPDAIGYELTRNFLIALTERVRAYDRTGKLPAYFIFLDQHYYEETKGWLWLKMLHDPLNQRVILKGKFEPWEVELARLQNDLRKAVDESFTLQIEKSQFGESWLQNRLRVQVNVTNPVDPSFQSTKVLGKLPISDNHMRDHRKIIFYDVTEDDPYRGEVIFTGMGIGEHYTGSTWEDRALIVQGPAALATKDAARFLLKTQGFSDEEIPFALRPKPKPPSYDAAVAAEVASRRDYDTGRALELHNETGFTPKPLNVAKAVLYSLMPAGSVMKVPDSLWQSYLYASLMAGSALRGCRVLVIAPSLSAAPSYGAPQMARANGLMRRLVIFGHDMDDYMVREGGLLRVGLYTSRLGVGDIEGRMNQIGRTSRPWQRRVFRFDASVDSVARNAGVILDSLHYSPAYLIVKDAREHPKLHLKANFFASPLVWDQLMARPEWGGILVEYIDYLAGQQASHSAKAREAASGFRPLPKELRHHMAQLLDAFYATLSDEQRGTMISYLTVGSVNMDYRSMAMNGEVMVTISGIESLVGVIDFILLSGLCEWPESPEEVDKLIPPPGWLMRNLSEFAKITL
jgi:hypothetical protein